MNSSLKNLFLPYASNSGNRVRTLLLAQAVLALALWFGSHSKTLPGPQEVWASWWLLVQSQGMLLEMWNSVQVLLLALLLSSLISLTLAAAATAPVFAGLVQFSSILRFLGFAGLSYVFMLLTNDSYQLKLALLVFGISVMMVTAMQAEVKAIDQAAIDHCKTLGLKNWRITWELVVLGKADVFLDLVRQNAAIGWTLLTMVEGLTRSQGGIGAMLLNQNRYFQLSGVFAIQLTILLYGLLQDHVFGQIKAALCPYAAYGKMAD